MSADMYERLFEGQIVQVPLEPGTLAMVAAGKRVVSDCFGEEPLTLSVTEFREALREARSAVGEAEFLELAKTCLSDFGFDLSGLRLDQVRLRALTPGLEDIPEAAAVFHCHRDTWYGNPKCQVNVWLPLHDVDEFNSFRFYPEYFHKAIKNDSEGFVASDFTSEGGFGRVSPKNDSAYPKNLEEPKGTTWDVKLLAGQALLFSAAHLHQSSVNRSGRVRFSLDFRFYHEGHLEQGLGAPDPDNNSVGLLLEGYRRCD